MKFTTAVHWLKSEEYVTEGASHLKGSRSRAFWECVIINNKIKSIMKSPSLFFDLAYAQEYGILYDVLNRYSIVPEPDVNCFNDGTHNGTYFANTPLSLTLKSTGSVLAQRCAESLIARGANLKQRVTIASEMSEMSYIRETLSEDKKAMFQRPLSLYACSLYENPISTLILRSMKIEDVRLESMEVPLLARAVKSNNLALIKYLLEDVGVDPNGQVSPQIYAKECTSSVPRSHENQQDFAYFPILLPMSYVSSKEALSLLLTHGAKIGLQDIHLGKSPFECISSRKIAPEEQKEILEISALALEKERGAKRSDLRKKNSQTPQELLDSLGEALFSAISSKNKQSIASLTKSLGWKNIVAFKNTKGQNLLFPALETKNIPLVKLLMARGLDINAYDKEGKSPLTVALTLHNGSSYGTGTRYDPKGEHRRAFREKFLLPHANLNATDALGRPLVWQLWGKKWDLQGLSGDTEKEGWIKKICSNYPRYSGSQDKPDPLMCDTQGETFIEYVLKQKRPEGWDSVAMLSEWSAINLFESALSHPRFTTELATRVLDILLTLKASPESFGSKEAALITQYETTQEKKDESLWKVFSVLFEKAKVPPSLMNVDPAAFRSYPMLKSLIEERQLDEALKEAQAIAPQEVKVSLPRRL